MKSRRRIAFSKANDRVNVGLRHSQSNQEIAIGKIGALVSLRSSNPEPPMSALGHKRTWRWSAPLLVDSFRRRF
jgi:hypothetical protein